MNSADYREEGYPGYFFREQKCRKGVFNRAGGNAGQIHFYSNAQKWNSGYNRGLLCCFFLILFLVPCRHARAQESGAFDKVYDKIWKETVQKDLNQALSATDSLYKKAGTASQRLRCLMLFARIYNIKEDNEQAVAYAEKLEKLAGEVGDYSWQTRANGFLSGLYRTINQYNKARSYLEKGLKIVPKIKDPELANATQGMMLQELALTSKDQKDYRAAIPIFIKAGKYLARMKKNRAINMMQNEHLLGDCYRDLKSYDTALVHYHKALNESAGMPVHYITGFIYNGLVETELEKGNLPAAKRYLDSAEQIANESKYLDLQNETYAISKKYYAMAKDQDKLDAIREKKDSVAEALLYKRADQVDRVSKRMEQEGLQAAVTGRKKNIVIVAVVLLLLCSLVYVILYRKKQQRELARFESILEQLRKKEAGPSAVQQTIPVVEVQREPVEADASAVLPPVSEDPKQRPDILEKRIMPEETELRLLKGLEDFQQSDLFLDSELSFSSLATQLNTNTKYLSYLIKVHKKTDFNSYINELRVNYIIEKLKNNPEWRHYKISALAATAGFSSHSQFAAVFKTFTGLPPSVFVKYLDKVQEQ